MKGKCAVYAAIQLSCLFFTLHLLEAKREWIPVILAMKPGSEAAIKVVHSDFEAVANKFSDESADGKTIINYQLAGYWKDGDTITIPGSGYTGTTELPADKILVTIPPNSKITDIFVKINNEKDLPGIQWSSPVEITSHSKPIFIKKRLVIVVSITPFKYIPDKKSLKLITSFSLIVKYRAPVSTEKTPLVFFPPAPLLDSMIEDSGSYAKGISSAPPAYLIVTTECLEKAVYLLSGAKLANHRYDVEVITLEALLKGKALNPENIKSAIREVYISRQAHSGNFLTYVVLAGDINKIPAYYYDYSQTSEEWFLNAYPRQNLGKKIVASQVLSDYYYADLEGNDLIPEVIVSRLPLSDLRKMAALCKILCANTPAASLDRNYRTLLIGSSMDITTEGQAFFDDKRFNAIFNELSFCYRATWQEDFTKVTEYEHLNNISMVAYRGHAFVDRWMTGTTIITGGEETISDCQGFGSNRITEIKSLIPFVISMTCSTAWLEHGLLAAEKSLPAFLRKKVESTAEIVKIVTELHTLNSVYPCFAREWFEQQKTLAFIGATRITDNSLDDLFVLEFFRIMERAERLGILQKTTIGEIYFTALIDVLLEMNLLGLNLAEINQKTPRIAEDMLSWILLGDPDAVINDPALLAL